MACPKRNFQKFEVLGPMRQLLNSTLIDIFVTFRVESSSFSYDGSFLRFSTTYGLQQQGHQFEKPEFLEFP